MTKREEEILGRVNEELRLTIKLLRGKILGSPKLDLLKIRATIAQLISDSAVARIK